MRGTALQPAARFSNFRAARAALANNLPRSFSNSGLPARRRASACRALF